MGIRRTGREGEPRQGLPQDANPRRGPHRGFGFGALMASFLIGLIGEPRELWLPPTASREP